jgi:hypothetical protein
MDAIRDIENHPAFVLLENEKFIRERLKVLKLLHSLKCHIEKYGLTERVNFSSHYKECGTCNQSEGGDVVDTCVCDLVGLHRYRTLKILDEIYSESQ